MRLVDEKTILNQMMIEHIESNLKRLLRVTNNSEERKSLEEKLEKISANKSEIETYILSVYTNEKNLVADVGSSDALSRLDA